MTLEAVLVWWVDSESSDGWTSLSDLRNDIPAIPAVGLIVAESDEFLTLAISIDPFSESANPHLVIPVSAIQSRKSLWIKAI